MAQEQQNISIAAPGFGGLNTQDSPVSMDIAFASRADHCIIDKAGRISSREGVQVYTSNPEILADVDPAGLPIVNMQEFVQENGTSWLFAVGNNQIYIQAVNDLVPLDLPVAYVVLADYWQIIPFNDKCFFFQESQQPLVFDPAVSTTALRIITEDPLGAVTGYPNCGTAAFGRVWAADFDADSMIVAWSQLLTGDLWAGGDSGSLDLNEVWPLGQDEVVALKAHNNFLIIFGKSSILVYNVPTSGPANMTLTDTISGLGCVARDSVVGTGDDIMYIDSTGARTLSRTIQEKSMPIGDVSINVRTDIKRLIKNADKKTIRAVYSPEHSFYAVAFQENKLTYVFDTRQILENGAMRTTRWPNVEIYCAHRTLAGDTFFAGRGGCYLYQGADDLIPDPDNTWIPQTVPIAMKYYTNPQTFDSPAKLKFPRQLDVTLIGPSDLQLYVYWAYDYTDNYNQSLINLPGGDPYYYNGTVGVDEYDLAEYGGANTLLSTPRINVWGSGRNVKFGFEGDITGNQLSIQELNIQALMGRII